MTPPLYIHCWRQDVPCYAPARYDRTCGETRDVQLDISASREDFDKIALERALDRLMEIVPEHDNVHVTVTNRFEEEVRAKVDDPEYAAAYEQERQFAVAMAKTIARMDQSTDLILDARVFSRAAAGGTAQRTVEHEALHIAVAKRGESLNDLRLRRGLDQGAEGTFSSVAGIAAEEYRVERALWESAADGSPDSVLAAFGQMTLGAQDHIRLASNQYQDDHDLRTICKTVMECFHAFATWTGYVAAEIDATGRELPSIGGAVERRMLGAPWHAVVEALRLLPPANVPTPREQLDGWAALIEKHLEAWLGHIGFSYSDMPDGGQYFGIHRAEEWWLLAPAASL